MDDDRGPRDPSCSSSARGSERPATDGGAAGEETVAGVPVGCERPGVSAAADRVADTSPVIEQPDGVQVSLVGAGPGHPDLLTRRAWGRLQTADVVLYDTLAGDAIIAALPPRVETIDVGKHPPNKTPQSEINELMRDRAARGDHVVRLKGGDPNIFGRGGEEAEYLAAEEIPFEVVSGISSVLAAASVGGISLTHRDCSSSLTVITGHQTPDKPESAIDWPAIARSLAAGGTLVILMGVSRLEKNVDALRDHGVRADLPVLLVEKATWADERTVSGTLADIVDRCTEAAVEPPAVTVVGEVVEMRDSVIDHFH